MNHEVKDLINDALDKLQEYHMKQLATALGFNTNEATTYLGTFDDLISIVAKQTQQLADIRRAANR